MNIQKGMDFDKKLFVTPPRDCEVVYGWEWNTPVTKELIDAQLKEAHDAGIKGLYVLPFPKNYMPGCFASTMTPDYLTDEFMELVKYTIVEGRKLGMEMWTYDEGGWPSGGACGLTHTQHPETIEQVLRPKYKLIKKGEKYTLPEKAIAAYDCYTQLPNEFIAERDMTVWEYYLENTYWQSSCRVDCSNKGVIDTFLNNTYERYYEKMGELFGSDISLMFTDEPTVQNITIPRNFFEIFKKEYGYDAMDYLPVIMDAENAKTERDYQVRIDYGRLLGKLFYENFSCNIEKWCADHNIFMGGHIDLEHLADGGAQRGYFSHLHALGGFDIPGIDVIWEQIRYPYGGRSPVSDDAYPFYPRVASSASRQSGRNLSLTESLGVFGDGVTPDEIRYVINYQAIRGINVFNFLMLTSGREGLMAMGERPVFCPQKPGFYHLRQINEYLARVAYLIRLGEAEIDTALYQPCADYWTCEAYKNEAVDAFTKAGVELERKHIPFDMIDDYAIMNVEATPDGLKIGDACYKHIVIPACRFMPDEVKAKVAPYVGEGQPLVNISSDALVVMGRKLKSGELLFVFNEGEAHAKEELDVKAKNIYRLDLYNGEMYKVKNAVVDIPCGDIAVFYLTDDEYSTVTDEVESSFDINGFEISRIKQFKMVREGVTSVEADVNMPIDDKFSGEITYVTDYALSTAPDADARYRISLKDTSVTASVAVNGKTIAVFGTSPMSVIVSGKDIPACGKMEVIVANTAANEIFATQDILQYFSEPERGPFDVTKFGFEVRQAPLSFGNLVTIEKLK